MVRQLSRYVIIGSLLAAGVAAAESADTSDGVGPSIIYSQPGAGSDEIGADQVFLLVLDAKARLGSIERHVYCRVAGGDAPVGVRIIDGEPRAESLRALGLHHADAERAVLLQCRRELPSNSAVELIWAAGIEAVSGAKTRQHQALAFRVRP